MENTDPHHQRIQRIMTYGLPLFLIQHSILLGVFILLKVPPLIYFNIASVILYCFSIYISRKGKTHLPALLAYLEISGSILLSTYCLGWESGFPLWIFSQTVTVFILYKWKYWTKWALVAFSMACLVFLLFILQDHTAPFSLAPQHMRLFFIYNHFTMAISMILGFFYFNWSAQRTEKALFREHQKSRSLLLNILPESTANRLSQGEEMIADRIDSCAILFADLVGFTPLSGTMPASSLVSLLNQIFCRFDDICDSLGLEKIKTIGDAYMVAAGIPLAIEKPSLPLVELGQKMLQVLKEVNQEKGCQLQLRIGIHSGKAVAGVIGKRKFSYDIWGDTVNIASRMESHGVAGRIQCSKAAALELKERFPLEKRGKLTIKGKGEMEVYLIKEY